jgi:hypothetical protein
MHEAVIKYDMHCVELKKKSLNLISFVSHYSLCSLFLVVKQHRVEPRNDKKNKIEEYVGKSVHKLRGHERHLLSFILNFLDMPHFF